MNLIIVNATSEMSSDNRENSSYGQRCRAKEDRGAKRRKTKEAGAGKRLENGGYKVFRLSKSGKSR